MWLNQVRADCMESDFHCFPSSPRVFFYMLLHGQSYRSPFNGPRFGAAALLLVLLAVQVTAALHGSDSVDARMEAQSSACVADSHAADAASGDRASSCCDTSETRLHDDDCECDCEGAECDSCCCYHPPMISVLRTPSERPSTPASPFVDPLFPSPLSKEFLPPILPPRS
jgi:hypothetical protein